MNSLFRVGYGGRFQSVGKFKHCPTGKLTMKTIKTILLSTALAVAFLSAGAFARVQHDLPKLALNGAVIGHNVTNIHKNSVWPVQGQITTDSCAINRCITI